MKYKIIGSSSAGNCIIFDDELLIDVGVPYSHIKKAIEPQKIKYVLLTHIHSDHFNPTTIRKMFVNTNCMFVCGKWLYHEILKIRVPKARVIVVDIGQLCNLDSWSISPILAYHDVPNCGYRLMKNRHKHIHITDTSSLDGVSALDYDSATIECNHHLPRALEMIHEAKERGDFCHLRGAINSHLSIDKAMNFIAENRIKKYELCHIGDSTKKEVLEYIDEITL